MKKIFKYFIFAVFLCSIFYSGNFIKVKAENFYEAEYIDDMWITRERGAAHWYQKARFFRNSATGNASYCLDPFALFNENSYYISSFNYSSLSASTLDKIKLAAYYGYGYTGRTSSKWYAITQVVIWRYAVSDGNFFFTNGLDGAKTSAYDSDINALINSVNNHYKKPSFSDTTTKVILGSSIDFVDDNSVLSQYVLGQTHGLTITKSGNKMNVVASSIGEYTMTLYKKASINNKSIFYTSNDSQNMMERGGFDSIVASFKLIIEGGYITINKTDNDTLSCTPQGEASIDGAIYDIYNSKNELVDSLTINNCTAKSKGLPFDTYTIKERQAGVGYNKSEEVKKVVIDKDNTDVKLDLTNKVIKSHIEITKLYGSNEEKNYKVEPNIEFGIYDKNNNLINTYKTDKSGYISFDLPYGTYYLKQLNTTFNYDKIDDTKIIVDEHSDKKMTYVLKNNLLTTKLKLIKKDKDTNKIIINNIAKFKIKNLATENYLYHMVDDKKTNIFEINEDGYFLTDIDLEYGKYLIEEVYFPDGYKKNNKSIIIDINEDSDFSYDDDGNKIYEIDIYNEKEELIIEVPDTFSDYSINIFNLLIKGLYETKKSYNN